MVTRIFFCIALSNCMCALGQDNGGADPKRSAVSRPPFELATETYSQRLAEAEDDGERLRVLAERWELVKRAVAHCDVIHMVSFRSSVTYWQGGWLKTGEWSRETQGVLKEAFVATRGASILVRGDCTANVAISNGALVHVYGDLKSAISVEGHCEIVVGGSVDKHGEINGEGIVHIFVGGDVNGAIRNKGSSITWIVGNLNGEIGSGTPSTDVHVLGDFNGSMKPLGDGALAFLDVRGFMASQRLEAIRSHGYTEFAASVGASDKAPGFYPGRPGLRSGWWVIHSQRRAHNTPEAGRGENTKSPTRARR